MDDLTFQEEWGPELFVRISEGLKERSLEGRRAFHSAVWGHLMAYLTKLRHLITDAPIVYYAHPMSDYGRKTERTDIETLESMRLVVLNPADLFHQSACQNFSRPMEYFEILVGFCDMLAFRPFLDGRIGGGVAKEIEVMREKGGAVIELPSPISPRVLTKEATREYLKILGRPGEG